MAGITGSVGGSAASGLEAGFSMGLRADAANDARKQREFENNRQTALDSERNAQTARTNARQDKADSNSDDDRALAGVNSEMDAQRLYGAGLAAQYGGAANIPKSVGDAYTQKATDINMRRTVLLQARYAPIVKKEQQWAQDTASRIQVGQLNMDDLSPADTVRLIQATTRRPVTDFIAPPDGKSQVKQAIDKTTAGIESNNPNLTMQGAGALMSPDLQIGVGAIAPDGSQIVKKELYALLPAPQQGGVRPSQGNPILGLTAALNAATAPQQPGASAAPAQPQPGASAAPQPTPQQPAAAAPAGVGTPQQGAVASALAGAGAPPQPQNGGGAPADPQATQQSDQNAAQPAQNPQQPALTPGSDGMLMPVLQVTAQHPDGTEVTYHAPVTKGRGTGADDAVHPGISMAGAMDQMGKLSVLEAWANTPAARAKLQAGLKDLGGDANSFLSSYYAMHGDAKALLPPGSQDPTTLKIAAYTKAAAAAGVPLGDYVRQIEGKGATGLQAKLDAIDASDLSDQDKSQARKVAMGVLKIATPKADGSVAMTPEAIDQTAAAALKDRSVLIGIGRDPNKVTTVLNRMAELAPGGDIAGNRALFGADKKSLDKMIPQYDAVVAFENNTLAQGRVLVDLAKKVDTTGVPVIERWIRAGRQAIAGDPDVTALNAQLQLFGNESAKILTNPNLTGVLSDSARHEVASFLPGSASAPQIERVVNLLENDFEIRRKSIESQTATITNRMADRNPAQATGISGSSATPGSSAGSSRVSPGDQAARDTDALGVLQRERTAIQGRMAAGSPGTSQGDLDAINKEIALAQKRPGVSGTGLTRPAGAAAPAAPAAAPRRIANDADYNALPSGATFIAPDGSTRKKP